MKTITINAPGIPRDKKITIAKDQPEFQPLHAVLDLVNGGRTVVYTMAFELTFPEIFKLLQTKRLWYQRVVSYPTKDPVKALESEGKFQPLGFMFENPLADTSDDLTAMPAVPIELIAFIEKFHHLRERSPAPKDLFDDNGQEMADALSALFRALQVTDLEAEPERASEQLFAIALGALRLSRLFQLKGKS